MTETLIVFVTAFAGFLFVDPFFGGALTKAWIAKVPVLAFGFGALAFHIVGRGLTDPPRLRAATGEVLRAWWPMIVLGLWITLGGAYARWGDEIREGFFAMGLGMLFLPLFAVAVRSSAHQLGLLQTLGVIYLLTVLGMLVVLGSGLHVFHEEIFLAVPLGAYLLCGPRLRWWQAIVGLALIGACLVSVKNTTFLLVLLVLAACFGLRMVRTIRRSEPLALVVGLYFGIPALVASVAGLYYAWKTHRQSLPSGNVEYRVEMYGIAWRRFLDSPIWGNGFTESSVNYFELYRVATKLQTLPTHSDILDLMAHGGLLALLLWLMGVWLVAKITWGAANRISLAGRDEPMRAWRCVVVLGLVQLCAIVTYAFNPPLISPVHAYWMWGSAAVMWALNQYLTEREPKLAVEPRKAPARVALA